ncbi:MAG: tetratricopeptide repeat protein [Candidatus Zixiibacteriota bacterium]
MKKKRSGAKGRQFAVEDSPGTSLLFKVLFVIVVLHIAGAISQSQYAWGFNFWSLMNLAAALSLLLSALVLGTPFIADRIGRGAAVIVGSLMRSYRKIPVSINYIIVTLILAFLFYWFRSRALVYGDGYLILEYHTTLDKPFDFAANFMKPLVVLFHRTAYRLLSALIATSPENLLAMINVVGGVTAFWALYRTARLLGRESDDRRFFLIGVLSCGSVVLFFGYIENYTWPLALGLWSLALTLGFMRGKNSIVSPAITGVIAVGFHVFCLPFLVIVAVAAWLGTHETIEEEKKTVLKYFNLSLAGLAVAVALAFQLADLPPYIVKLWPVAGLPYWFLSPQHLVDVVNEMILAAPVGTVLAVYFFLRKTDDKTAAGPLERTLASLTLMTFMITFWIDPKLGAARDWDLLSFVGIPLTLWSLYRFHRQFPEVGKRPAATVILVIVLAISIVPNLMEKNDVMKAAVRLDKILFDDIHYQLSYLNGERCDSWGYSLEMKVGDSDRAQKYFQRRIKTEEGAATLNFALGRMNFKSGNINTAYQHFKKAVEYDTANPDLTANLATVCNLLGKTGEALDYARRTTALDSLNTANLTQAGIVFSKQGYADEARQCFYRVLELEPNDYKHWVNIGLHYDNTDNYDSAYYYYRKALTMRPDTLNINPQFLFKMAKAETVLGQYESALAHCRQADALMPGNKDITALLERLSRTIEKNK